MTAILSHRLLLCEVYVLPHFTDTLRELALSLALANGDVTAATLLDARTFQCIAITAYAEARGEGLKGMALVVQSMINRHNIQGKSGCRIAQQAYDGYRMLGGKPPKQNSQWNQARMVAMRVIIGEHDLGECSGVTHFLNPNAVRRMPNWASPKNRLCRVGNHVAYRVHNM